MLLYSLLALCAHVRIRVTLRLLRGGLGSASSMPSREAQQRLTERDDEHG